MTSIVRCQRRAMATEFELWLAGDDPEHLSAAGEAALDEIERVESVLSRHDPRAELARINRLAANEPVLVSRELGEILAACFHWDALTRGCFDIRAGSGRPHARIWDDVDLNLATRTVRFRDPAVRLDLGGFGKGFALDSAAERLAAFQVEVFLMHGGTSSLRARGAPPGQSSWKVDLRDPFAGNSDPVWKGHALRDRSLSISATFARGTEQSDIIDPRSGKPLDIPRACMVETLEAAVAEALSTALVILGPDAGRQCLAESAQNIGDLAVCWISPGDSGPILEWWKEPIHA